MTDRDAMWEDEVARSGSPWIPCDTPSGVLRWTLDRHGSTGCVRVHYAGAVGDRRPATSQDAAYRRITELDPHGTVECVDLFRRARPCRGSV